MQNQTKVHALLWGRCSKGMKSKLEARKDYQLKTSKGPVDLLKAIKEHALNFQENKYPAAIVHDSLTTLLSAKQQQGESLIDYTKRFKNFRDVVILWRTHQDTTVQTL
jgi:regulator of sigma D